MSVLGPLAPGETYVFVEFFSCFRRHPEFRFFGCVMNGSKNICLGHFKAGMFIKLPNGFIYLLVRFLHFETTY